MSLQTLLGVLFGVSGAGAITVLVASYRRLRVGKINDDESIIKRLYRELTRQEERADDAEHERDDEARQKNQCREQAARYRLQLIEAGIEPRDMDGVTS